jgi:PHP family Zn ribbon phosphoesterase
MTEARNSDFRKADLHIHTPKSTCYNDPSVTPEEIVDAAVAAGLEVIAVTDHNSVAAVDDIRKAAEGKGLFVFPGVELTTKSGHFIALFELGTPMNELEDFLASVGINRSKWGDAHTIAGDGAEEILRKINRHGGISIAAHIDRWPSGFLETKESRQVKRKIYDSEYLNALEITIPQSKSAWNNGKMRGFHKKRACIQGSDSHDPGEIARRPVYIQMAEVSLEALRQALVDYGTRILFPEDLQGAG